MDGTVLEVSGLYCYPVKSMSAIQAEASILTRAGLQYDRWWMVIDAAGSFVSQREIPELAIIKPRIERDWLILASGTDEVSISIANESMPRLTARVWDDECQCLDEGEEVAQWLWSALKRDGPSELRLVRRSGALRAVKSEYLDGEIVPTAFADSFPFLLTSESSLTELNCWLEADGFAAIPMSRFRPNIVVQGLKPFYENDLRQLAQAGGDYELGVRKPCRRCKVTAIDQTTGTVNTPTQPLGVLVSKTPYPEKRGAYFGQYLTLLSGERRTIRVGDRLRFL